MRPFACPLVVIGNPTGVGVETRFAGVSDTAAGVAPGVGVGPAAVRSRLRERGGDDFDAFAGCGVRPVGVPPAGVGVVLRGLAAPGVGVNANLFLVRIGLSGVLVVPGRSCD